MQHTLFMLKDKVLIEQLVKRLMELQGEESFNLRLLQRQSAEVEKGIENMLKLPYHSVKTLKPGGQIYGRNF